jgi:hypothetical protein
MVSQPYAMAAVPPERPGAPYPLNGLSVPHSRSGLMEKRKISLPCRGSDHELSPEVCVFLHLPLLSSQEHLRIPVLLLHVPYKLGLCTVL